MLGGLDGWLLLSGSASDLADDVARLSLFHCSSFYSNFVVCCVLFSLTKSICGEYYVCVGYLIIAATANERKHVRYVQWKHMRIHNGNKRESKGIQRHPTEFAQ